MNIVPFGIPDGKNEGVTIKALDQVWSCRVVDRRSSLRGPTERRRRTKSLSRSERFSRGPSLTHRALCAVATARASISLPTVLTRSSTWRRRRRRSQRRRRAVLPRGSMSLLLSVFLRTLAVGILLVHNE